ncbi:uncharacterized protein [Ptychodera flava]|uniref:uncharacterized protein n=1 Tax=Ptychodera flava TaxID=63121 RepID=UPI00396AAB98
MEIIIFLLSSLAYASAFVCCPPTKWEGQFGEFGGYVTDKTKENAVYSRALSIHVDSDIQKLAYVGVKPKNYKLIQDYSKKLQYAIEEGMCTKSALQGTILDDVCIPERAVHVATMAHFDGELIADSYMFDTVLYDVNVSSIAVVERSLCTPFGIQGLAKAQDVKTIYSGAFFNITTTIEDPSVFDVPAICAVPVKESGDSIPGSQFIKALLSEFEFKRRLSN